MCEGVNLLCVPIVIPLQVCEILVTFINRWFPCPNISKRLRRLRDASAVRPPKAGVRVPRVLNLLCVPIVIPLRVCGIFVIFIDRWVALSKHFQVPDVLRALVLITMQPPKAIFGRRLPLLREAGS